MTVLCGFLDLKKHVYLHEKTRLFTQDTDKCIR